MTNAAAMLEFPAMSSTKSGNGKKGISLTLDKANIAKLKAMAAQHEFPPSVSDMVNRAIAEYIERRESEAKKRGK